MKFYTTRDVARLLGLSEAQVRSHARGYLAPARGPRNAYRFSFQDLRPAPHRQGARRGAHPARVGSGARSGA